MLLTIILGRVHVKDFTTLSMIDVFCILIPLYGLGALDMNALKKLPLFMNYLQDRRPARCSPVTLAHRSVAKLPHD